MKRHEIIFSIVKVPLDFCMVFFSFFIARELRLVTDMIPGVQLPIQTINSSNLQLLAFFGSVLLVVLFASHRMYTMKITSSKIKETLDIIRFTLYWFLFFAVFVFLAQGILYHGSEIPRLIIIYAFFISTISIIISRVILNEFQLYLLTKGIIPRKSILLITNKAQNDIGHIITDIKQAGVYDIIGYTNTVKIGLKGIKYIALVGELEHLLSSGDCEEVLYIDSDFSREELFHIWELSRIFGVRYRYITNSFDVTRSNTSISLINHIPVIEINTTPLDNWGRVTKRVIDIIGSTVGIIIFSPLILVTSFLIKLEEPFAPVIYKNRRVGQGGKIFSLYKFRYIEWKYCIKDDYGIDESKDEALAYEKKLIAERSTRTGPLYKIKNDPRKTRIGRWIEKYSIDELPQFFNVLLGNMSLVGPRPHQPREVEKYDLHHKMLLTIKPGITGMAQVHGREKNDFEEEARLDTFYIENWSFLLDLKIILKTFVTILMRR